MEAYFDIFSGISGNMVLGAILDLGLDEELLKSELGKLGLDDEFTLNVDQTTKNGIAATFVEVELTARGQHLQISHDYQEAHKKNHDYEENNNKNHGQDVNHKHNHEHDHNNTHNHNHNHNHDHAHNHNHKDSDNQKYSCQEGHHHPGGKERSLQDIKQLINSSKLEPEIKEKSILIFERLARAEALIHDTDPEKIHFHEVGATDAIIDIVGSVLGLYHLGVDRITASPLATGTGFVNCEHGVIPVPAPATMELLRGIPIYSNGIEKELVTPTGAAIITTLADEFVDRPEMVIEETGYGAGSYELESPNLLRVNLFKRNTENKSKKKLRNWN